MKTAPLISAFALLALAGCNSNRPEATATESAPADELRPPERNGSGTSDEVAAMTPQQFVNAAAASDNFEIESSRIAAGQAKSAAVKEFARKMIDAHSHSTSDLKSAAAQTDPVVTPDPALTDVQKSRLEALRTSGNGFDRYYIDRQIEAHEQALSMLKAYGGTAAPGPLHDFAVKMAPNVANHLSMAMALPR